MENGHFLMALGLGWFQVISEKRRRTKEPRTFRIPLSWTLLGKGTSLVFLQLVLGKPFGC